MLLLRLITRLALTSLQQPGMPAAQAAPKQQTTGDMFGDFQNGGAAASTVSKDSIMSLYNQPIAPTAAPPGYGRPGVPQGVRTPHSYLNAIGDSASLTG